MKKIILSILFILLFITLLPTKVNAQGLGVPSYIVMDKSYIQKPLVSSEEIEIESIVYDQNRRYCYNYEVTYSIISGNENAKIVNNKLVVLDAGEFTIRADVVGTTVFEDYQTESVNGNLSGLVLINKFEDITVYTQPIKLEGTLSVVATKKDGKQTPAIDAYYDVCFKVISGPASIFSDSYLKIEGEGEVTVEAYSPYDKTIKSTKTFVVINPDKDKTISVDSLFTQSDKVSKGCKSSLSISTLLFSVLISSTLIIFKKRKGE